MTALLFQRTLAAVREAEQLKKSFKKFLKKYQDIIVQCNLKINNYLDITLNLNDGS